jgi:uncharacterized protein (TIGR00725 family)
MDDEHSLAGLALSPDLVREINVTRETLSRCAGPREPVAIVGPRHANLIQLACARNLGYLLGLCAVPMLCGGKSGVMEAACRGVREAGGVAIGLLPEEDASLANPYVTVAIPTGMGIMRNALIARGANFMIAIGRGLGTHSEMALALQWGKPVFAIHDAPQVPGLIVFEDEAGLMLKVVRELLARAAPRESCDAQQFS